MVIGENLRRLREEKHLSVKYVKEYLRLGSVQAIYKYESGKGYPQADTMFAMMQLYGANIDDIVSKHEIKVCDFKEDGQRPSSFVFIDCIQFVMFCIIRVWKN